MKTDITCRETERLARFTEDELSAQESKKLNAHLKSCASCSAMVRESARMRAAVLEVGIVPRSPGFSGVAETITARHPSPAANRLSTGRGQQVFTILRYASGIAAIFFLSLFSWEQAIAVKKLSDLQTRIQGTVSPAEPGIIDRLTIARAALVEAGWADLAGKLPPAGTAVTRSELAQARAMIQGRIRFIREESSHSMRAMSFISLNRNALNIKEIVK
jgi:hypothetical protein